MSGAEDLPITSCQVEWHAPRPPPGPDTPTNQSAARNFVLPLGRQLILTCPPGHVHQRPLPYRPQTRGPQGNGGGGAWGPHMGGERRTGLRNAVHLYDSGGGRGRSRRDAAAPPRSPHPLPAGGSGCGLRAHCDGRPGGGCPPHGGVEAPPGAARPDAAGRRRNRANEAHPQDHRRAGLFLSGYGGDQNIGRAFEWEPPTTSSSPSRPTEPVARIEAVLRR